MSGDDHERRVRDCAYYLWQHEGCPDGRDGEFWERALLRIAADDKPVAEHLTAPPYEAGDEALRDTFPASDPPSFTATKGPAAQE